MYETGANYRRIQEIGKTYLDLSEYTIGVFGSWGAAPATQRSDIEHTR
jgi:hypothetical protein